MSEVIEAAGSPVPAQERQAIEGAQHLPLGLIQPNAWNRQIRQAGLADLADSIRKHGVLQPVLVRQLEAPRGRQQYELVAGERRWRASQLAGMATVPALVRTMDDLEVIELMLIENLQREGLHELDEATGYDRLLRKESGTQQLRGFATVEDLAARIGKSKSYIAQRLRLLALCEPARKAFREEKLSFSLALRIARLPNEADQVKATKEILAGWGGEPLTARAADDYIHRTFMLELDRAPFKITDETLVPAAGSCRACPKRTGANEDLFGDIGKKDTCTDSACYQAKEEAHRQRLRDEATASGMTVIEGREARKLIGEYSSQPKGYLLVDEPHHAIDGKKPLGKLLGKGGPAAVLIEHPRTKKLIKAVPEAEALKVLRDKGLIKQARLPSTSASERQREERAKRENAWRTHAGAAIVQAALGDAGAAEHVRAALIQRMARVLWREMTNDVSTRVGKLMGWPPIKSQWGNGAGITAEEHFAGLNDRQLAAYFMACAIAHDTHIGSYQTIDKPKAMAWAADLLKLDLDAIREEHQASTRTAAKTKGKKPTAQPDGDDQATPETALAAAVKRAKVAKPAKKAAKRPAVAYRDAVTGSTWSGRGLQPQWLRAALANGHTLAEFRVDAAEPAPKPHITDAAAAVPAATHKSNAQGPDGQ